MNTLIRLLTGHRTGGASPSGKHHFIGLTPLLRVALGLVLGLTGLVPQTFAALTEGFESGMPTSYTTGDVTLNSGTWTFKDVIRGTTRYAGSYSCQIRSATDSKAQTPDLSSGVGTIEFWVRASTSSGAIQVNLSTNGGTTWSAATGSPFTGIGTTWVKKTITVNDSDVDKVEFRRTGATIYLDDVSITDDTSASGPEMAVLGKNDVEITDGDSTPSTTDGTDWGSVSTSVAVTNTFTITNSGTANLTLTTPITLNADTAFSIDANPSSPVAANGTTTFKIKFAPTTPGATYTGEVSIANNDSDENPYNFSIEGTAACFTSIEGLRVSATNATEFTVAWTAVSGADGYVLDVSTNKAFGGGGGAPRTNDFSNIEGGTSSSYLTRIWTNNTDVVWTAYKSRTDQKVNDNSAICLQNDAGAYIECTTIPSGINTLKFDVGQAYSGSGGQLTVYVNGTSKGTVSYSATVQTAAFNDVDTASVTSLVISNNTSARPIINNLIWTDSGSPDYIDGYSNKVVSGTSHTVTGLTLGVKYYYRLTATNTDCTAVSDTNNVTTVASTPEITLANNGTVSAANVATGTVAHVLLKFSAAVTTADAELNTVAFTTAGNYDANDLTNLKLWYSADSTLNTASDSTIKTITSPAAAGAKSFTGLSQAISAGNTGYFFITADIAKTADFGHTLSINAIANADLTFAAGNKSGSASAGGTQTFVALAPTSNGSLGSFTSVGAASMVVNWTSGNGERRIVVVREGSATSWTPSDGTAPSGVDADFSSAANKANGNKICYDGTGTSFTLSGLSASTTYYVTIFEYNGTTTYVKYYTAGTEASGSQATISAGGIWINPMSAAKPMGTYYLGDTMGSWNVQFEIGQTSWNYAQVGIGTAANGTGYSWGEAAWYEDGSGNNKRVQRDLSGYQYTSVGSHYVICQAKANAGDTYTSKSGNGWGNPVAYPPADLAEAYFTCSALGNPTSPAAVVDAGGNTATRADLSWTQWSGRNVLITIATAVPSGSPTQGTAYSADDTFGNQTVISGSQSGSALEVTDLTPGQTYYFRFYSENHSYYSSGTTATALTMGMPKARNTSGGATPGAPAGTIYLGDTAKVFTFESWGTIEADWGQGRLWLRQGNADLSGGTSSAWSGYVNTDAKSVTSGVFNATGTWYWGIQADYGATYGADFWYKASSASWVNLAANGTGASLSFSVSAIVNPSGQGATTINPTRIDLGWTKNAQSHNVMVVRKTSAQSWTEPTQGTGYAAGNNIGAGVVVYNGSAISASATSLTAGTAYDFKFYSVNNDYYSAGVTAQATTFAAEPTQAYNLVTNTCGVDSLGLTWTSGSGANRIVVVTEYDAAGLWLFDEGSGTTAKDSTVNGNDGTFFNSPTWTTRTGGAGAVGFSRTAHDACTIPNNATLQTINSQTISFWIRPTDFAYRQNPWDKAYGGEGTITLEPTQTFNYYWGTAGANGSPYQGVNSSSTLSAGPWTHIVLVRDLVNSAIRWYFNGTQVNSATPSYAAAQASTADLAFGNGYAGALNGDMSEPMLLDYALTATEVGDLYAMGSLGLGWEPTDGVALSGTISASFTAATDQGFRSKIVYNGTGNSMTVTGLKPNTAYRVRVFEYNGTGATANYNTDTATDNPSTFATDVAPPTSLSAAAASATSIALTFGANAAGDDVVIVADPANTFSVPSGPPPAVGAAFAGGTVVYKGTSSPQTHSSLDSCTRYYYRAWSYANGRYSTAVTADDTTDTPAAPTTLWVSDTNLTDFTAAWSASDGASRYRLDVSSTDFGSGSSENVISKETMGTSGSSGDSIATHESNNRFVNTTLTMSGTGDMRNTLASSGYTEASGSFNVMLNSANEYFTISGISSAEYSSMELSFGIRKNTNAEDGSTMAVEASTNGTVWVSCGSLSLPTGENGWYYRTLDVPASMAGANLRIRFTSSSTTEFRIDDISLTGSLAPSYVPGYSNLVVSATSQSVTGLTESTTYYFRVRPEGDGSCTGANSSTENVTTLAGAPPAPSGLSASDGTSTTQVDVSWDDVANETGYVIWRHTADAFGSATAIGTNAADDTTYSDTDVAPLDVYYYWVTATNAIGSSTQSNSDTGYAAGYTLRYTGFEGTTNDNWSWVPTAGTGMIGPRDDTGTATGKTGDYALMLRGSVDGSANPSVLFDNMTLPVGTSNISVSVGYACVGPDGNDNLFLDISYDNGATWSISTQLIAGASNIRVNFGETRAGNTADANPYVVTVPDDTTQVRVRVRFNEASADNTFDRFFIDEVKLIAGKDLPAVAFSATQTIKHETNTTAFNIPITISSAADATVRVAIAGTALPGGTDFTATTTNIVFTAAGATTQNLQITLVNDTIAEGPESVRFTLTQADGCRVAGPDIHTLFIRDDDAFSVVSANLVSGTVTIGDQTAYDDAGQHLLRALAPDIVAIQEWVVTNSFAQFVTDNFGSDFYWVTDGTTGQYAMPNGIISRWPIVETHVWDDAVGYRQHIHAKIKLPGTKNLNLVSVHLKSGDTTTDIDARILGARNLTNAIEQANFSASDYLLIAGDLNTTNRSATELSILTSIVSDAHKPTDKAGSENTNPSKARPYDYVLPDSALEIQYVGMNYNGTSFPDGMIFDTREWGDHQYPALGSDSEAANLTHAPVMKVFSLGEIVEPPASFSATASAVDQIDLTFATNAAGDGIVIVYNETGTFTDPVGAPPASGAYAGGTVVYRGTGSSHNHTGLESCTLYYYKAWSYSATPVFSTALTASDTTDAPAAPTALHASATNQYDFTAEWTAASGAASYVIDVSEDSGFGGGAAVNLMSNGSFETGDTTDWDTVESQYSVVTTDPQEGTYHVEINATATRKLMQQVSITGDGTTEYEVSFYSKGTGNARIWASWSTGGQDSGDDLQPSTYLSTQSSWTKVTYNVVPSTGANVLNFEIRTYTGASRQYDNFFVGKAGGAAPSYVDGYEQRPVAGTSVSVAGLTDAVTYYYRVASVGDGGCTSSFTAVENVTTLPGPPPQPTGLTATKGTILAHVELNWTDLSAKETGYVIYRHTADVFGSATAIHTTAANVTTYNDTTAVVGTRYYYWIVATNAIGSSAASDSDYGFRKLATVGGLSASDCSDTAQVSLSWTDIDGETGYGIWRNTSDNSSTATFLGSAAADATSYNDTTATPGTLYTYWVRATNSTLVTQSDFQASGASGVRQLAEVIVSASDGTDTARVVVNWTDIVGETGYAVWRSEIDSSATAEWQANVAANVTTYSDEEAVSGTQYYYWVLGTNATSECHSDFGTGDGGWRRLVENPSSTELTRDGREMVRAAIAPNANTNDILVLYSTVGEVTGVPALNSSYSVGDTLGNAKVVYTGAAANFREHVVSPNTTNHYRVFSVLSNIFYSSGPIPTGSPVETKAYQPNVGVETFSYTNVTLNTDSFTNKSGGANWATGSNWVLEASGTSWQVFTNDTYDGRPVFYTAASNMATHSGNRAFIDLNGPGRWGNATRQLPTISTGTLFVSALMAYRYEGSTEGADRWLTMALMNGSDEELEFGKVWGANRTFTIRRSGANASSSYGLNPYGDSTNNWYWVVLKYDFENDIAEASAFYRGEDIPSTEPSTWDVEWSTMAIAQVTGLRLKAGSGTDWLGGGLFDDVRVSSVWPALLGEPDLVITPEEKNFGDTEVGRTDVQRFWVENIGGDKVPLSVSSLTLGGTDPTNFFLSTNTLGMIEYGQSNSFVVSFIPDVVDQDYAATLYLTNSSGVNPVMVSLQGTGIPSQLTNAPAIDDYWVGETNQVTDAMVTSGVFSVVIDAYHPAGIATAKYDLLNSASTVILADQTFESWTSDNGEDYVLSNATHTGYWPATPADDYLVRVTLISSNVIGTTNTTYGVMGGVESDDLFISEYIEGSVGNNKAIEIYNGTGAAVDLSDYTLRLYRNGATSSSSIQLSGTLAAGGVYVVAHSSANAAIQAKADQTTGSLDFNGNDVVALAKNGSNIDVIGTIGSSVNFAKDVTKVRKSSVTDGVTTYATSEWDNKASDTISFLGAHTMDGGVVGTPMEFAVVDDDTDAPVITSPLVNATTTPAGSADGPSIAIGDVPAGGFDLDWDIQDTGSGVFAASNHYTLTRSNVVISSGAVTTGSNGDGKASALAVGTTVDRDDMIWGNYVLSLAGHDYDPEWVGDISSVSNVYYFVIAAPSIGVDPTSLAFGTVDRDVTSNLTVTVTNSGNADLDISSIGFTGTGSGYFSIASPAVPLTVTAGNSADVVVSFTPTAGGTLNVTMTLNNNSPDHPALEVPITAVCFDPETAPPSIYDFTAVDSRAITNEVTDHALGHSDVTLNFTLWHYAGMAPAGASYDLLDPAGDLVWTNGTFDSITGVTLDTKECQVFSATVPGFYPAVTGVYTARVTATSSNVYSVTDEAAYAPLTAGEGVPLILDRFSRPDASDDIGAGWATNNTGETIGNIQLRDHALQFYGIGGTAGNGRLSVVRAMTGRYNPVLTNNTGTLTWAFNFYSGQANMTGLGSGKYAGLYILGSTSTNFVGGYGNGYAVRICSNQVALVKFTGGLNSDSDATTIGTPANLTATTPMGIRVDLDPATGAWTLYTTNWGGSGPEAFGDPLAAAELATSTVDATYLGATSLPYVGCYWNHGAGAPGNTFGAVFDDVYAPYVMPAAPLMNFSVVDEDWTGPVHSDFNTGQYTVSYIDPGGLTVTGLVADANGVYAGTSNVWTLFSNSTQVASGSMTMTPETDGAGTTSSPAALSTTIPFSALNTTNGTFIFQLVSTDYDVDRPGDSMSTTSRFTIVIVDTEAPTPTSVTAVGDGMEMAVLTWNLNGAQGAVVLRSADPDAIAGATILTMGEDYNQGDAGPNGTTVAYNGTNQAGAEIVLPMGSLNYFRLFGANGTVYSAGHVDPTNSVQLLEYEDGEIVDQFAYTNNYIWTHGDGGTNWMYLNDQAPTGQGWDGGWTGDVNDALTIENINLLVGDTQYPDPYANKLQWVPNTQEATSVAITRKLATPRGGRTFIAFMMNYKVGNNDCDLSNKYIGLSLMSGTGADTEEIFFGKLHGKDKDAGINVPGTGEYVSNDPYYAFNAKHHDDYMIVGEWDSANNTVRMWAFYKGDTNPIPQEYTNATPIATYSNATFSVADITGIRLAAGMSTADTNTIDHAYFDEVRVGDTWDEVLLFNYPEAWNFKVGEQRGTGTNTVHVVTDGQLAETGKAYPISYLLNHRTGVTNAQFNIITDPGELTGLYDSNIDLELDPGNASDRSRWFTNWVTTRLSTNDITLGVYTTRVWMTAVSGKATNTIFMEGRAGATDLFFGEFGEGNNWDKYVEIYNGTGGTIDLSQYKIANQQYGKSYGEGYMPTQEDYLTKGWANFCRLSTTPYNLGSGQTVVIVNGENQNVTSGNMAIMTNALANATPPRAYLVTTNLALQVGGNDPVALFKGDETNLWIDTCAIAPEGGMKELYIMRRKEDAVVPRSHPLIVDPNQWDYRDWNLDREASPVFSNFLWTAGLYDRDVGLGGYITFTVEDDDAEPPRMGTNSALMVGTTAPYTSLAPSNGAIEVVLTAWNFGGTTVEEGGAPWSGSLLTNASVSCSPAYTPELVDFATDGTTENNVFGAYEQIRKGRLDMAGIGTYFTQAETAWIQFEIELTSAEDMVLSWAEAGGNAGFETAQLWWSSDGQSFSTNAAWPSWVPRTGGANTYATRYAEFDGVVTPGLSKVYIRIVLGPGYGTSSGTYRMDNVQLTGYPQEFQVTDAQIAASGNRFQFRANVYDTNSGLNKDLATMALQGVSGNRVSGKDIGDGSTTDSTLWWELEVDRDEITDYVNESLSGKGLTINVQVPDADADRPNDQSWLNGRIGQVRVIDDDTKRPKLTLTSMKPLSSILAQWAQMTNTTSLLPTKSDAGVDAEPLKTKSGTDDPKNPNISREPTNGYHYIEAFAWHGQNKCWLIEITPEADMALTNLTFTSYMHRTNGVSNYRIDHYVDGALEDNILTPTYWVDPPGILDPDTWYTQSHGWAPDTVVLEAGKVNQIRIYGLGSSNLGARWRISELTLWQAAMSTDGVTEVTDAEFTSGTFKLEGNAWDTGSGIASPTHATPAKRPMFSLNAPDGGVLVSNQLFEFLDTVVDGGATTQEEGAFEGLLPTPIYTNVMLGGYTGEAHVWDYDDDRTDDDLLLRGDLAMYVVDNDNGEPTTVGTVKVNGNEVPGTAPDRLSVDWTNQPRFIVSFDSVAVDQDPGDTYSLKQRALTGIGEYRVATNEVNTLTPSNRATRGKPYPVATTNGALANYGFEMLNAGWVLDANCSYWSLVQHGTNDVKEGTNSLRQINGGVAYQTIEFRNTAAVAPIVGVSGWYRSDTAGGPTFRIEAFATNNLTTPVAFRDVKPDTAATWHQFAIDPVESLGDGTVEVLKISLIDGGGNTTFWDDIRLSVDIGDNTPSMRFTAGIENQGLNPQYLFAVDADNNRAGDRLAGEAKPFYIAYDVTPPTVVGQNTSLKASTDSVDDPTTQFDLLWSTQNVGPDNPEHANHPTKVAGALNLLSPWQTYKIYYGDYNVLDIPAGDNGPGSADAYIYTNFITEGTYKTWSNRVWNSAIADPGAPTYQANYHALTNLGRTTIRLYDLDFDQDYAIVIVGVDKAGNEGPAGIYSWATNNTIKFSLTRGWGMAKDEAEHAFPEATLTNANATRAAGLAWTASGTTNPYAGTRVTNLFTEVKKEYDLIYWDAPSFRESSNNVWKRLGTVQSNWFVDDGGQGRKRGDIRFYRASYKDRWRSTRLDGTNVIAQRPIASEEVYAMHNVVLSPGQNFVALHGVPYTNTFEAVFGGTETFPGGDTAMTTATTVEFFTPGISAISSSQYFLDASGHWIELTQTNDVTTTLMPSNFFNRGFSITLPDPLPTGYAVTNALDYNQADESNKAAVVNAMIWSPIAQVPTNSFSQVIHCGTNNGRSETLVYNVVALRLPVAVHPSQMRLLEGGFVGGAPGISDEIYTMNTATKSPLSGSTIYYDSTMSVTNNEDWRRWKFVTSRAAVPWGYFKPNDVIVIISRNGGLGNTWIWNYHPGHFYPNAKLPDRWLGQ